MKRMKKWLIGGLAMAAAATMALSLTACGDNTEKDDGKEDPPVTETAEIEW